jgi:predicted DCC family thiol-disulfide oxidoreductase YuxK
MIVKVTRTLIYDDTCPFCNSLAHWLADHYAVAICSGRRCRIKDIPKASLLRDVHFIEEAHILGHVEARNVYVGAAAAAKVISLKHPFVWSLYNFKLTHWFINLSYIMLKKIRKYLHLVF